MTGRVAPPISIVGAGNWLLTHDRVGPHVLEKIAGRYGDDVEICDAGCGGLNLLDFLRGQPLLLVVDASVAGLTTGLVRVVEPDLDALPASGLSVHQIGPIETLAVARALYPERLPGTIRLILVETAGIDELTLETACDEVVARLDLEIARWRESAQTSAESAPAAPGEGFYVPVATAAGDVHGTR